METIAQADLSATPAIVYKDLPVITTETLAGFYTVEPKDIRNTFKCCAEVFVKGDHYFRLENDELYDFNNRPENKGNPDNQTINLILWTRRGAALLAKLLHFDEAWTAYENLENTYFKPIPKQPESLADIAFKASHIDIKQAVHRLSTIVCMSMTAIYLKINRRFAVKSYKDIPLEHCSFVLEYIQSIEDDYFKIKERSKLANLQALAGDITHKVMDHYNALYREIARLGGVAPERRNFDEQTIVRYAVTRVLDRSRILLTFNNNKPNISFVPLDSMIINDNNIAHLVRESGVISRQILPEIIAAATDRLACR